MGHGGRQQTTAILCVVTRRLWKVLQLLLESENEKGQQAVNKVLIDNDDEDGCTPIFLAFNNGMEGRYAARKCIVILFRYGADVHITNASGCPPYYGLTVMKTPRVKKLKRLVDKAPVGEEAIYWSGQEVQDWVGTWNEKYEPQCPVCLCWTDDVPSGGFKTCSRCKSQHYCSQKCQRIHWSLHRSACS